MHGCTIGYIFPQLLQHLNSFHRSVELHGERLLADTAGWSQFHLPERCVGIIGRSPIEDGNR
jgi:hypothetical protein